MEKPLYQHLSCDSCAYLGRFHDGRRWTDLYHCPRSGTLIVRWGDAFDAYYAMLKNLLPDCGERVPQAWRGILEADHRARK